jgi:hypothetical protein
MNARQRLPNSASYLHLEQTTTNRPTSTYQGSLQKAEDTFNRLQLLGQNDPYINSLTNLGPTGTWLPRDDYNSGETVKVIGSDYLAQSQQLSDWVLERMAKKQPISVRAPARYVQPEDPDQAIHSFDE